MPITNGKITGTNLTLDAVEAGLASSFRQNINNNSEAIVSAIDTLKIDLDNQIAEVQTLMETKEKAIYAAMVNIQVSKEQPTNQKPGDLWFQILDD